MFEACFKLVTRPYAVENLFPALHYYTTWQLFHHNCVAHSLNKFQ
jgi:hypothetical protein